MNLFQNILWSFLLLTITNKQKKVFKLIFKCCFKCKKRKKEKIIQENEQKVTDEDNNELLENDLNLKSEKYEQEYTKLTYC